MGRLFSLVYFERVFTPRFSYYDLLGSLVPYQLKPPSKLLKTLNKTNYQFLNKTL